MKIVIIATGSRGDVQPYIALGKGLSGAGHSVRLLTHQDFEGLVEAHGLDFRPISGSVQEVARNEAMQARLEKGSIVGIMAEMAKEAEHAALRLAEAGLAACAGTDLLLGGMGGLYLGLALSEKFDLPFLQAHLLPFTPTAGFPSVLASGLPAWVGAGAYRVSHHLVRQVVWQSFRKADLRARREVLGLPPAPFSGPYRSPHLENLPVLYGYSPAFLPAPADWGPDTHVTGYWFLESEPDWAPSPELTDFLEAGPPPVYVGFGSMSNRDPVGTARLVIDAVRQAGQRAILLGGWGGLRADDLPRGIFLVDAIPHAWLFDRVSAVVHHGGAGTTGAGLRAGVPSVIVPFFGDQPFWGMQVAAAGVGPQPVPRKKMTAERLAGAIRQAVEDEAMRARALALGQQVRAEDGITRAVEIIGGA